MTIERRLEKLEQSKPKYDWCLGDAGLRKDGRFIPCPYLDQLKIDNLTNEEECLLSAMLHPHGLDLGVTRQTLELIAKELSYPHESRQHYLDKVMEVIEREQHDGD